MPHPTPAAPPRNRKGTPVADQQWGAEQRVEEAKKVGRGQTTQGLKVFEKLELFSKSSDKYWRIVSRKT